MLLAASLAAHLLLAAQATPAAPADAPAAAPAAAPVAPEASATFAGPAEADQATLQAMHQAYLGLTAARGRAHLLLGELNAVRLDEKLAARARARPDEATQADAARRRLTEAWSALYQAVGGPQPIDPRGACRLEERTLREALAGPPGSAAAGRLPAAREEAGKCLSRLSASQELARTRVAGLEGAMAEARQALGLPAGGGR